MTTIPEAQAGRELAVALERARDWLLARQDPAGWSRGRLETNVTMDAEDLLLREFLGIRDEGKLERAAWRIRSQQRADGTWANFHGGPPDLSTTVEAYVALKLAGDPVDADHMRQASAYVRANGGLERTRVFTHIWLALFGLWSWDALPALPAELILLPSWVPLNPYDFACWARQTLVALSVVIHHRPARPLGFGLAELAAARACAAVGREPELLNLDEVRLARIPLYFSSAKAQRELGYEARGAEATIAAAVDWFVRRAS